MTIKEVSNLTGLTERTIRFYIEKELISPALSGDKRKIAEFSELDLAQLNMIIILSETGLELKKIRKLVPDQLFDESTLDDAIVRLEKQKASIDGTINYIKIVKAFGNNEFITPFFNGLKLETLQNGNTMIENLNKGKASLSPEQTTNTETGEGFDISDPENEAWSMIFTAITLLSYRYTIEKPESETTQNLLSRLYKYVNKKREQLNIDIDSEHEFAKELTVFTEDSDEGLSSVIEANSGKPGLDFLSKAISIYIIRTEDNSTKE